MDDDVKHHRREVKEISARAFESGWWLRSWTIAVLTVQTGSDEEPPDEYHAVAIEGIRTGSQVSEVLMIPSESAEELGQDLTTARSVAATADPAEVVTIISPPRED